MPRPARNFSKARKAAEKKLLDEWIAKASQEVTAREFHTARANAKARQAPVAEVAPTKTYDDSASKAKKEALHKAYLEELAHAPKPKHEEDEYED